MKRSKHNLSNYRLHTAQMGDLFPIGCTPVLPGDTVQQSTSMLVRAAPLNTPVMHPVSIRIHHWFVPNRIVWDEWEDFITGGPDGNDQSVIPTVSAVDDDHSVLTYLGVPYVTGGPNINGCTSLALRAYNKIFNEFYRDQDLATVRAEEDQTLAKCAWEKDYFTTARPWTQKGTDVTVPIAGNATVIGDGEVPQFTAIGGQALGNLKVDPNTGDNIGLKISNVPSGATDARFKTDNTGLTVDLSTAQGVAINDFREAFAIQRYQEARARYGSRFTEYLRYLGINPSDARLQLPEYLGGGTQRLQFSEVLQTAPGAEEDVGVGDLYGHGIAGVRTPRFRKFFEEHGYVISLCSVRPKSVYFNSCPREFLKSTKEDFYQKELVHLGQQEVYSREVNSDEPDAQVYGYQDRYDEYRSHPSIVGQEFKTTLSSWTLARDIPVGSALNESFITCDPSTRIFQVTEGDNMWCMANHKVVARRLLPRKAMPRIQ